MRLYVKLTLIFLLLFSLTTFLASTAYYLVSEETSESVFVELLSEQNKNYINNFNKFITENIRDARIFVSDQRVKNWRKNLNELKSYLKEVSISYPSFESILIIDEKGIVKANSSHVGVDRPWKFYDELIKNNHVKDYHWEFLVDEVFFKGKYFLLKKIDSTIENSGYLVFEASMSQIDSSFSKSNKVVGGVLKPKYNIQLENKKNLISNFLVDESKLELKDSEEFDGLDTTTNVLEDEEYIYVRTSNINLDQINQEEVQDGKYIPNYHSHSHWILTTRVEKEDVESPAHKIRDASIYIFLFLLVLSSIVITYFVKQELNPITDLVDQLERLGAGKFEQLKISKDLNSDIQKLLMGYNSMIVELEKTILNLNNSSKFAVLGEMASGIAHEINNPLQIIRGFADMQIKYFKLGKIEKAGEYSTKIIAVADRIAKIIVALKTYAHSGAQESFQKESIKKIIDDTFVFCDQKFKVAGIQTRISIQPPSQSVECRPVQVSQVLLNLLNNAYDVLVEIEDDDKWIEIDVIAKNNKLFLSVINSGPKISEDVAKKLFLPFFTTKAVGKGTGLGMSIIKNLVEHHNGIVKLDYAYPYTKFLVELPIYQNTKIELPFSNESKAS